MFGKTENASPNLSIPSVYITLFAHENYFILYVKYYKSYFYKLPLYLPIGFYFETEESLLKKRPQCYQVMTVCEALLPCAML